MLGGTACFYAFYILKGWETMDLVGLVTTTIEAAAALVVLSPSAVAASAARQYAVALAALPVALVSLLGTNVIASVDDIAAPALRPRRPGPRRAAHPAPSSERPRPPHGGDAGHGGSERHPAATAPLSLPTNSPAGNIELARHACPR